MANSSQPAAEGFNRARFESLLRRRFFFTEAFEIYRTSANHIADNRGLYDYGPPGCALQANIVNEWRNHFVIEENMMELDCTVITPEPVLKTSGHVDKFADWMCKDPVKGDYLRADHLVESVLQSRLAKHREGRTGSLGDSVVQEYEEILAKIDNYDGNGLAQLIERHDIRNPDGNGQVLAPIPFNLMFKSSIGPSAAAPVYLRPETAQGHFLNFKKLLDFGQGSMPFASASIGKSYRNEISPRSGLLRVREFLMAEIEHFVDPETDKRHDRFPEVSHIKLPFLDKASQLSGKSSVQILAIGEAVEQKLVNNETLGYFLARTYLFLIKIGIDCQKLRFRQHLDNEMAHYACDCWDAELLTSYGWIECVGCADRSAYDLSVHSKATGTALVVKEPRSQPIKVDVLQTILDKKLLGTRFKKDAKKIELAVASLDQSTLETLSLQMQKDAAITIEVKGLSGDNDRVHLGSDICAIKRVTKVENLRQYTPNVIEPSFGIGRILYSLLEHVYWHREYDVAREVLSLPASVAPTKVLIVPLSNHDSFKPIVKDLAGRLRKLKISNNVDASSTSIGKRYARNDELGTPFGITVDFDTVNDGSVTLRERDTTLQVRSSQEEIVLAIRHLVDGVETWEQVANRLPTFTKQNQQ
ncbi:Putative glycine--tRNA ligase [Hirsutella minnesotensis 3608]|nr:Putative glycine--tRNA ligase [Hirsutella minnesotensis 3608]